MDRLKGGGSNTKEQYQRERRQWEEEKLGIESKLEEALAINSKLFDKVKRLEQQVRELVHQQDAAGPLMSTTSMRSLN